MRAVFTVPVTVGCDARYIGDGPGRLHLNACGCERIESIAGRKPETVGCARDTIAKLQRVRVGKSVWSNDYITSRDADP
jgi:hypothetical protein